MKTATIFPTEVLIQCWDCGEIIDALTAYDEKDLDDFERLSRYQKCLRDSGDFGR